MSFEKMKPGDCFWVIGHEKIQTKFSENQNIWLTSLEEPTFSLQDKCFITHSDQFVFYQGSATQWMNNIPKQMLDKLHNKKLYFELEFIDITLKGCFRLKATGRLADFDYVLTLAKEK